MSTITDRVIANARKRGVTVLDHKDWGSVRRDTYESRRHSRPAKQPADTVVQHITVTRDTGDFKADMRTVERIGWERFQSGVSYNFVVNMRTGHVGLGQFLDAKGTHTVNDKGVKGYSYDQNYAARAIAVLGMENDRLSDAGAAAISGLLAAMIDEGAITKGFDYDPHSKFAWKDCPCDSTRNRMVAIRKAAVDALVPQPEPVDTEFGVVTHNIRHALEPQIVNANVRRLMGRDDVDILLLQEMGGRRGVLSKAVEAEGWELVMPDLPDVVGESSTPILYDPAVFDLKRVESIQATERTKVPARAAGPSVLPPKFITGAHLLHKVTGRTVHVYNGHWPASQHLPEMRTLADTMTKVLEGVVADDQGPVIVGGDLNQTKPFLLAGGAFERLNLTPITEVRQPKLKTHGKRFIDWIFGRSRALKPTHAQVLTGYASDHRPLLARFDLTMKPSKKRGKRK